jgi:hypothetical protein
LDSSFLDFVLNFQTLNFTLQTSNVDELIYSGALMDGMMLGYWVAMVGRGVEKIVV